MAYLLQFKNDLFVSYRRVSNQAQDQWVDGFCKALSVSLKELVGDVTIWRDDDQLRTGERWRTEIAEALDGAAIFLAIISRTYLDSDECRRELDRFLGCLKDPTGGGERKIVPIFKQPPKPEQDLPHEMGEIHRHNFFHYPPGSNHFREFSPDRDGVDRRAFWEALERVAQDIMVALERLKVNAGQRAIGKVFVARVSPELQLERDRLRADLQQRGYLVVPEQEYLWNSDGYRDRIVRDLESAQLSIHLVTCAASIESTASMRARLQLELARDAMRRKERPAPMVWIQPSSEVDAGAHALLNYIKSDLADEGVEYWERGLEDFKTQIYDRLLPPAPPRAAPAPVRQIALVVEESDVSELGPIRALLVDRLALDPVPIKFAGTSPKDAARLARTLAACEQCLIFWNRQPEEWVLDLLDSEALAGHLGRDRMCIYAVGLETPEKRSFQTTKARTILVANGLNEPDLLAFFGTRPAAR
jgi:hypothetical protein